jgi:hypothetical protein
MPAIAQQASDFAFATAPLATDTSVGNGLLLPSLDQSRRALLMSAAQGETLAELQALAADPQGLAAGVQQRELVALPGTLFRTGFLEDSDRGSSQAQAPYRWLMRNVDSWNLSAVTTGGISLEINETIVHDLRWPGEVSRFDGVFEADDGQRRIKPMWRLKGQVWRLDEAQFVGRGLQLAEGLKLIALQPRQGGLRAFLQDGLDKALLRLNERLRAGIVTVDGDWVLAVGSPFFGSLHGRPTLGRAGDPLRAQLGALNGVAQVAELDTLLLHLGWDEQGLKLTGRQNLRFHSLGRSGGNPTYGSSVTDASLPSGWPTTPPPCPSGEADLRPMVLLLVDAQHRLLMLAKVAAQGEPGVICAR